MTSVIVLADVFAHEQFGSRAQNSADVNAIVDLRAEKYAQEDHEAIGGLRALHRVVKRLPGVDQYKNWLWPMLERALPEDKVLMRTMSTLGVTDAPSELQGVALKLRGGCVEIFARKC